MSDYDTLPEEIKQHTTKEQWDKLMAELAEITKQAQEATQYHG